MALKTTSVVTCDICKEQSDPRHAKEWMTTQPTNPFESSEVTLLQPPPTGITFCAGHLVADYCQSCTQKILAQIHTLRVEASRLREAKNKD